MPKVFATVPGAEVWIPPYGTATNDRPCLVPPAVAEELTKAEGLRVEAEDTVTLQPGTYERREELNAAIESAASRGKRPKSEKE